jgi:hypothetical protein
MITGYEVMTGEPETGLRFREPWRRTLITLELLLSLNGIGGGVYLMVWPRSAMPMDMLADTPFATWFWPGVLLTVINGFIPLLVAIAAIRRRPWATPGHLVVGLALIGWILVQVAMMGYLGWLQPALLAWGIAITAFAYADYRY